MQCWEQLPDTETACTCARVWCMRGARLPTIYNDTGEAALRRARAPRAPRKTVWVPRVMGHCWDAHAAPGIGARKGVAAGPWRFATAHARFWGAPGSPPRRPELRGHARGARPAPRRALPATQRRIAGKYISVMSARWGAPGRSQNAAATKRTARARACGRGGSAAMVPKQRLGRGGATLCAR